MKKTSIRTFSLAALVGMTVILTNAVRAAGTPEEDKGQSGVDFGELNWLKSRAGSSAVRAAGDGGSRQALTVGKPGMKALREGVDVPSPAPTNNNDGAGGLIPARYLMAVGSSAGLWLTGALVLGGGLGLVVVGGLSLYGALRGVESATRSGQNVKEVARAAFKGALDGAMVLANMGAYLGEALTRKIGGPK